MDESTSVTSLGAGESSRVGCDKRGAILKQSKAVRCVAAEVDHLGSSALRIRLAVAKYLLCENRSSTCLQTLRNST